MDLLADVLKMTGLKSRLLVQRSMRPKQVLKFPCDRSFGFHVVVQGELQLTYSNNKKIDLHAGDIALMSRGVHHQIKNIGNSEATLVGGVYQLWNDPIHPFFSELPDWWVLKGSDISTSDSLFDTLKILSQETTSQDLGSESIMHSLLDILFNLILRRIVKASSDVKKSNWSKASQDEKISAALKLMHQHYQHPWSLEKLAQQVGLSRAGFAQKFKSALGDTPLNYLASIRIQQAMRILTEEDHKVDVIASTVGYSDAFSFSKAFKKRTGQSPIEFRKQTRLDAQTSVMF